MEQDCKQNISQIEQIRERMKKKGWKQADLARATGVSTGVLSRFFGNDGISDKNLFRVMTALDFFKGEPILEVSNSTKGGHEKLSEDWQMKMIIEQIGKRIDAQNRHIDDVVKVMSRFKDELQILQNSQISTNQTIDEINKSLISIKGRMLDAANSGNVEALGGDIVNE